MTKMPNASGGRASFYATLALIAAMLMGGAAGYALGRRSPARNPGGPDVSLLGLSRDALLDSLGVNDQQREEIEQLLSSTNRRVETKVLQMMGEVRGMTDSTRQEVRGLLTQEQRTRFDSLLAAAAPVRMRTPLPPGSNAGAVQQDSSRQRVPAPR